MSSLKDAERKIQENDFSFDDLPDDRSDPIWNQLLAEPYKLKMKEMSALKNARCKLPGYQELSSRCSSVNTLSNEKGSLNSPDSSKQSLSDVTNSSSIDPQIVDDVESGKEEIVTSSTCTLSSSGISARLKTTLQPKDFSLFLHHKWPPAAFDLYLEANFPSMFQIKKEYLDKISQAAKKTKNNEVDVRFEDIAEHVSFLPTTIQPIIEEVMKGVHIRRGKRDKSSSVSVLDNPHRSGFLRFIEIVWQGLDFDPEGFGLRLGENSQVVDSWSSEKVRSAFAKHICHYLFGKLQSISIAGNKIVLPTVEDIRKVISSTSKSLRKQILSRTAKVATVIVKASGIDKDNLNLMDIAKQLKPTVTNGKKGILGFTCTNLNLLNQSVGGFKASKKVAEVTIAKQDKGQSFDEDNPEDNDEDESSVEMVLQSGDSKKLKAEKNSADDGEDSADDVIVLPVVKKKTSKKPRLGDNISPNFS